MLDGIVGWWDSSSHISCAGPTVVKADRPQLVQQSTQDTLINELPQRQSPHLHRGPARAIQHRPQPGDAYRRPT